MSGDFRGACLVFRMPPKMAARRGLPTTLRRSILGVSLLRAQGQNKISHGRLRSDWITRPADRRSVPDWIASFRKWRSLTAKDQPERRCGYDSKRLCVHRRFKGGGGTNADSLVSVLADHLAGCRTA